MTDMNVNVSRKYFIDNIRSFAVITVIVYHVAYLFNSAGVFSNIGKTGIPAFDTLCYFVFPWLMNIMFLAAGISARYALQKRTVKQFIKERAQKLLITLAGGIFLLGWITGWVTNHYIVIFGDNNVPVYVKYAVFCLMGIGPLWFIFELFLITLVLLIFYKIDKNDRLTDLAGKANIFIILALFFPFWGSSFLLNPPLFTMFRNGIYLFVFLAGYYIFSQEKIIEILSKFSLPFLVTGLILGITEVFYFYGQNYTDNYIFQHLLTNIYSWIMMMAILGCSQKYINRTNKFLDYIKSRSFFWYLCHYPIMVLIAYILVSVFKLHIICVYILLLVSAFGVTIIFCEIIRLIPVLRYFLFGIKNKEAKKHKEEH
jgi:surface polysaccharide O-acyltransferase-like enzyme